MHRGEGERRESLPKTQGEEGGGEGKSRDKQSRRATDATKELEARSCTQRKTASAADARVCETVKRRTPLVLCTTWKPVSCEAVAHVSDRAPAAGNTCRDAR